MFNVVELRQVDLNLLVVFATVFRDRSVKRAAQHLLLGQSAVSMALGRLRELFRDDLFVKVAGGVEPTSKAVAIEPHVRQALEHAYGAIFDVAEFNPANTRRVIRVGLPDDLELWLLPRLLDDVQRIAPGVTVVVHPSNWYVGQGLVERGEVDVVLGVLPTPGSALMAETLFRQRFFSIFDPEHVAPPLSMKRFLATPHVMVSISGDLVGVVDEALRAQGKERRLVATVPGFAALGALLKGRLLIATMPDLAAETLARSHGLTLEAPPISLPMYPVSMVWHTKTDRDPALHWFRARVRGITTQLPPASHPSSPPHRRRPTTQGRK